MRFDHAVIGVADLEHAVAAYRALGFVVAAGGRHTGEGTHNAIVRFGLQYLELMAVHDEAVARSRPFGSQLLELLNDGGAGLIGYVVAADDLDTRAIALRRAGLDPVGPFTMQRERSDGRVLSWRLLFPRGQRWRDPAPFVIEWGTPDAERVAWDAPVAHRNGVMRIAGLEIRTTDVAADSAIYASLGLPVDRVGPARARVPLGDVRVDLVTAGPLKAGLAEVRLLVNDMDAVAGVIPGLVRAEDARHLIPRAPTLGAQLSLVGVSAPAS